jgi:F0F1-type ATP synthase membrane subunit c/vacuolar-type H+-ATPase subunit K
MRGANATHIGTEIMWEMLGYLAVGLACITCAIVIGAAFD